MRRNNNNMQMPVRGGVGGPLMTDHLQDLELELELLKRKRQLIQRQQSEMLFNRGPGADDNMRYNQPSQAFNDRFNEPQKFNFSHMYNEAPRDDRSFGLKRRAEPEWSNAPGDRFDNPMGGNKRPRQSGPFNRFTDQNSMQSFQRPRPNKPQPLMGQPKPLMNFQSQPMRRAPQPQTVAKQNQGPKPLTHHPNFKRNKQPGPSPRPGFTPNKTNTPFKKTTPIKTSNTASPVKKDKKAAVLSADQEPSNKTTGRLELALGMIVKEIKVTYDKQAEYAGIFSSLPLMRGVKQTIRERVRSVMAGKVVGLVPDIVAEYRKNYPLDTDKEIMELALAEKQRNNQKNRITMKLFEEGDPEEFFKKNMNKLIEARFAEMLQKLEKVVRDSSNITTEEILENLPELKKTPGGGENKAEEESAATEAPTTESTATKAPTTEAAATEAAPETTPNETEMTDVFSKAKNYEHWISLFLERKLPGLMARNKYTIFKIFDLDHMFRNTKAAIITNTNQKAQAINNGSGEVSDPGMPRGYLPYFAKVHANPSIPKRSLMQEFLNKFNPKSIKRHKKNFNLLFIGFNNKDDYDRILAANQTVIGNATLTIDGNVVKTKTIENDNQNDIDQVLTPQLDDQINDLLSSIRKADEEAKDTSNTTAEVDLTTDDNVEVNSDSNAKEKPEDRKVADAANVSESDVTNGTQKTEAGEDQNDDECQVVEPNGKEIVTIEDDEVAPLKSDEVKADKPPETPAKGRAPATPSTIRTRRSSRLVQN